MGVTTLTSRAGVLRQAPCPEIKVAWLISLLFDFKKTERGHVVAQLVGLKVTSSIPDGVLGIFFIDNPSGHNMAVGSTQPLTEMSTRNISLVVKTAGATFMFVKSGTLSLLGPSGRIHACTGISLPLKAEHPM